MSIKDYSYDLNKREMTFILKEKSFSGVGYWLRSIKSKLRGKEIKSVSIKLDIEYLEGE